MSLLPVIFLRLKFVSKHLRKVPEDHPHYAHKREKVLRVQWKLWVVVGVLVIVPLTIFVSTILASLERTPLTGRYVIFQFYYSVNPNRTTKGCV